MNDAARKDRFHVPQSITWKLSNGDMNERFRLSGDYVRSYIPEVQDILNAGIDFFFYAVSYSEKYIFRFRLTLSTGGSRSRMSIHASERNSSADCLE